ncbi:MAG: radical SAM family heme chaperone HemW [Gammaproteobacteria bacterium]|nr:radical SAM family heme chaperone HemW [Gammaproteobacteria bacterium]
MKAPAAGVFMKQLQLPPLSLYVHIPWCVRKCPYCDFNSHQAEQVLPEQQYVAMLLQDLEQELELVQGRELHSVFFGGGTPSLFSGTGISEILQGIGSRIPLKTDAEVTLEANPGTAEAEKFHEFVAAGINRISLGVQSFNDNHLQALGRIHDSDQAQSAIELAQGIGLSSFNIDLMHGLPGQSIADARCDLQLAAAYRPPHISWYQLTIEPNTTFYKKPPRLPAESVLADIQDQGEAILDTEGYRQYEVSAFARNGYRCHHNLNYWQFGDYLGIGAGAHSKLTDLSQAQVLRFSRTRLPANYMALQSGSFRVSQRVLTQQDLVGEYMMNALRLADGFELCDFTARTGLTTKVLNPPLHSLLEKKLLQLDQSRVSATALGRRYLDSVVAEFFA